MKHYKYIFTDLDGTLYNVYPEPFTVLYKKNFLEYLKSKNYDTSVIEYFIKAFQEMKKSDGVHKVEELYYNYLVPLSNYSKEEFKSIYDDFIQSEYYHNCISCSSTNENMQKAINLLHKKGYKIFLTTNPVFSRQALLNRVEWAKIDYKIFEYITSFENHYYTKPNKDYFLEVVNKFNLNTDEILMIGNDTCDDTQTELIGIDCYIVTDNLINSSKKEISTKYHSSSKVLLELIEKEF